MCLSTGIYEWFMFVFTLFICKITDLYVNKRLKMSPSGLCSLGLGFLVLELWVYGITCAWVCELSCSVGVCKCCVTVLLCVCMCVLNIQRCASLLVKIKKLVSMCFVFMIDIHIYSNHTCSEPYFSLYSWSIEKKGFIPWIKLQVLIGLFELLHKSGRKNTLCKKNEKK